MNAGVVSLAPTVCGLSNCQVIWFRLMIWIIWHKTCLDIPSSKPGNVIRRRRKIANCGAGTHACVRTHVREQMRAASRRWKRKLPACVELAKRSPVIRCWCGRFCSLWLITSRSQTVRKRPINSSQDPLFGLLGRGVWKVRRGRLWRKRENKGATFQV